MVERGIENPCVAGSSPVLPIKPAFLFKKAGFFMDFFYLSLFLTINTTIYIICLIMILTSFKPLGACNMKTRICLLLTVIFVISTAILAEDYPQWRGINRDGVAKEVNLLDSWPAGGPAKNWSVSDIGIGYSSPIEVNGVVYITGMKDKTGFLTAIDRNSGKILWQKQYGPVWWKNFPGARTTPTFDNGKLYLFSSTGNLTCFDAESGDQIWQLDTEKTIGARNITWGIAESVVVDGDIVYATPGADGAAVIAVNKNNGSIVWRTELDAKSAYCSPLLVNYNSRKILITALDKMIVGIDAADGKVLWQNPHKVAYDINANTPIYDDGIFYISNGYKLGGKAFKINPDSTGTQELWHEKRLSCHFGGLSYKDGIIYGIGEQGKVHAVELKTGNVVGSSEPYVKKGSLILADGKLFCYGESSRVALVKFDGKKFSEHGMFSITEGEKEHWAHPVVSNGSLYIRHGDYLMSYKVK